MAKSGGGKDGKDAKRGKGKQATKDEAPASPAKAVKRGKSVGASDGKTDGKTSGKVAVKPGAKANGKAAAKAAMEATAEVLGKAAARSAGKPERIKALKNSAEFVEQVAAEIVAVALDQAVSDERGKGKRAPDVESVVLEEVAPEAVEVKPVAAKSAAVKPAAVKAVAAKRGVRKVAAAKVDGSLGDLLRVAPGPVDLSAWDTAATPGVSSREQVEAELPALDARLEELQERLFAAARGGDSKRRVLLLLQGMDTAGKGGSVRHVVGRLDPNGVRLTAFKAPTEEERAHDFLWRVRNAAPRPGELGIFDRSQYEDVLIARVRKLALPMVIGRRYSLINKFEQDLAADGCVLVKAFLHLSPQVQRERLLARLDEPTKRWKYNPGDVDERELWPAYQDAYRIALEKCSTEAAPWYVVPADHKWYRNYAIARLVVEALERIDPIYPPGDYDVDVERQRVLDS